MTKGISKAGVNKQKLDQSISLLKFVLDLDDEEIVKSAIESVIEAA